MEHEKLDKLAHDLFCGITFKAYGTYTIDFNLLTGQRVSYLTHDLELIDNIRAAWRGGELKKIDLVDYLEYASSSTINPDNFAVIGRINYIIVAAWRVVDETEIDDMERTFDLDIEVI